MARITVEDCLEKENNRFALVLLATQRAKQILMGSSSTATEAKDNKAVVSALREVAEGNVRFMTQGEIKDLELKEAMEKAQGADPLESILKAPEGGSSDSSDDGDDEDEESSISTRKEAASF